MYQANSVLIKPNVVHLSQEVYESDAWKIIDWLEDMDIIRYLNESQNVCDSIRQVIYRINMPILTHLFNQNGSFFMIADHDGPVGFLKLVPNGKTAEMVIVIGDKEKWGRGLGTNAISQGLSHAFFELRMNEVIAKIHFKNERSRRVFKKAGFTEDMELPREMQYSITLDKFV
jgi:RimJ/RimL family protein N-acetyltransferase